MNSFLLSLAALLVLALSALFAGPHFIEWNDYRDHFEAQASKLIGRTVDVGGDVSLTLLPAPVLRFENVNVADAQGQFDTPFAAARSFTVWLSVPPLLRGTIEAREVEINQPVVNLRIRDDGSVNWSDIGGRAPDLPFIPADVTLNSVIVTGATLALWRGGEEPDLALEQLSGELSARSLNGPYKFAGRFNAGGDPREVRFSTARQEADGSFRLKLLVHGEDSRASYSLDGMVKRFGKSPQFTGQVMARFTNAAQPEKEAGEKPAPEEPAPVEVKAKLDANFERARFSEVEATIRLNNKPQTINGRFEAVYTDRLGIDGEISARWVDFDSWVGAPGRSRLRPDKILGGFAREVVVRAGQVERGRLDVAFDQAALGGDVVTNLELALSAEGGELNVDRLSATLPGDNDLMLAGQLAGEEGNPVFSGEINLDGGTLAPLLQWAGWEGENPPTAQTGEFSLKGDVTAASDRFFLENASGSLFGSAFTGGFRYDAGANREVSVNLESDRLDLARAIGGRATPRALWRLIGGHHEKRKGGEEQASAPPEGPLEWLGNLRAHAEVRIGAVSLPGLGDSRVEANLSMADGTLNVPRLLLTSAKGASVQAGGKLKELGRKPEGNLTLAVQAANAKGLSALARFFELPEAVARNPARVSALAPLSLTAALHLESENDGRLKARLEGSAGGSEALVTLQLEDTAAPIFESPMELEGRLANSEGKRLLRQLFSHLTETGLRHFESARGEARVTASGVVNSNLEVTADVEAAGVSWNLSGRAVRSEKGFEFTGKSEFRAHDIAAPLLLAGGGIGPAHSDTPLILKSDVEVTDWSIRLANLEGDIKGISLNGEAKTDLSGDKPVIEANLAAARASLPRLLGPLIAWSESGSEEQEIRGVSRVRPYWPDRPFNSALLGSFEGELMLKGERMTLAGDLALNDAQLEARLSKGSLTLSRLEGGLYGGAFDMRAELARQTTGMAFTASANAKNMRLERIAVTGGGEAVAEGPLDLEVSVTGEGLTPSGLAAGLTGQGKLAFGTGRIHGLSPQAPAAVAKEASREENREALNEGELAKSLARHMSRADFSYEPVTVPFAVRNGVARLENVEIESGEGRAKITSYLQLTTLELDSEWVIRPDEETASEPGPHASLIFAGPLEDLGRISPRISAEALARYITMNRMEKDVERLERLDVSGRQPSSAAAPPPAAQAGRAPAQDETAQVENAREENTQAEAAQVENAEKESTVEADPETREPAVPKPVRKPSETASPSPPAATAAPQGEPVASPEPAAPPPPPQEQPAAPATAPPPSQPSASGSPPQTAPELPWLEQEQRQQTTRPETAPATQPPATTPPRSEQELPWLPDQAPPQATAPRQSAPRNDPQPITGGQATDSPPAGERTQPSPQRETSEDEFGFPQSVD